MPHDDRGGPREARNNRLDSTMVERLLHDAGGVVRDPLLIAVEEAAYGYFRDLRAAARGSQAVTLEGLPTPPDPARLGRALWPVVDELRIAVGRARPGATLALADRAMDLVVRVCLADQARTTRTSGVVAILDRLPTGSIVLVFDTVDPGDVADDNPLWNRPTDGGAA